MKLIGQTKNYIWGGHKLKRCYGKSAATDTVAESWELSVHPDGVSRLEDGRALTQYLTPDKLGINAVYDLGLMIKLIDAKDNLSVQVHPDDGYAKSAGSLGKREMWYILDVEPGCGIYCGFKRDVTIEELEGALRDGTILELLNFFEVAKGDCFFIEAGVVHAIGKGVTIYELQQSSNLTYRLYDYNRVGLDGKPRELHIKDALAVADKSRWVHKPRNRMLPPINVPVRLGGCKDFAAYEVTVSGEWHNVNYNSFVAITVIDGDCKIGKTKLGKGDTFWVSSGDRIQIASKECKIIMAKITKYYLGIDIGGTHIKGGVCDEDGIVLASGSVDTQSHKGGQALADNIAGLGARLIEEAGLKSKDISGIGVGIPGIIDSKSGIIAYSNNMEMENVPIAAMLSKHFGQPISIANDANAAALGEFRFGAGKAYNSMVMITLGTGVGSGIIVDGKLIEGNEGAGAEIGHMAIRLGDRDCNCGRKGCFEAYSSTAALIRDTKKALKEDTKSRMHEGVTDYDNISGKIPFEYASLGDKTAKRILEEYLDNLAEGLVNVGNIFRPDAILIGGGVSAQGDNLLIPLRAKFDSRLFGGGRFGPPVELKIATLGNDAGFLGAAALCMPKPKIMSDL